MEYFEDIKGLKNVKILREKIKKNALISVNGFPMRAVGISGKNDILLKSNVQLVVDVNAQETIRKIEKYVEKNKDLDVSEKYDGFTSRDCSLLYQVILDKLTNTVYCKRPAINNIIKILDDQNDFAKLDLKNQAELLYELLTLLRCDSETKVNLQVIGGKSNVGTITVNKNTLGKSKLILINQSVTGLFENRIEL